MACTPFNILGFHCLDGLDDISSFKRPIPQRLGLRPLPLSGLPVLFKLHDH